MDHDVGAVLNRADKVWGSKSVVDYDGDSMLVGDGRDGVNVGNVGIGVSQSFKVDGLGVGLYGAFDFFKVVGVYKSCLNAKLL